MRLQVDGPDLTRTNNFTCVSAGQNRLGVLMAVWKKRSGQVIHFTLHFYLEITRYQFLPEIPPEAAQTWSKWKPSIFYLGQTTFPIMQQSFVQLLNCSFKDQAEIT